jgi:hypothetical protein
VPFSALGSEGSGWLRKPTVTKGICEGDVLLDLTMDDMVKRGIGLFRIGVAPETAPYNGQI